MTSRLVFSTKVLIWDMESKPDDNRNEDRTINSKQELRRKMMEADLDVVDGSVPAASGVRRGVDEFRDDEANMCALLISTAPHTD